MTDGPIVARLADVLGGRAGGPYPRPDPWKPTWNWIIYGDKAIEIMEMIYPHMGKRRQAQIDKVLEWAESRPGIPRGERIHNAILNPVAVQAIRHILDRGKRGDAQRIARAYGISHGAVRFVGIRHTWKHVPEVALS